jgi:hypothetical protein
VYISRFRAVIALGSVCVVFAVSSSWGQAPDIAERARPAAGEIEFENESMVVIRIHMAPHEKILFHEIVGARLVVWLTEAHLKDVGADGSVIEYQRPAGSVNWITPRRHMGENLSDQDLEFLAIIPKTLSEGGAQAMHPH